MPGSGSGGFEPEPVAVTNLLIDCEQHQQSAAVISAGDLLTQLESIDYLRRHRQLSVPEAHAALVEGLTALLT